jgi:D-alanyl-D-alanine carboxypeptidase
MGIGATILMIILFPLNSFLLMQGVFSGANRVQADVLSVEQNSQGLVQGMEIKKIEEIIDKKPKAQAVDNPKYYPVRKEGVKDLVIPNAHASIIIDADTGEVLHSHNEKNQRQIASLTKLMTAALVMEKVKNLDEKVIIDEESVYIEGTKIGCPRSGYCISQRLKVGEEISVKNLLQAMLMNSANDAAAALGKYVAGSQNSFAEIMNKKAKDLGLANTHFCTPSGLETEGRESECYSSAYDIARIAAFSLRYDTIWKMLRMPNNSIIESADRKISHTILNTDLVLDQIPNIIGAKTGFTPLAGHSLLMVVSDPGGKHRIVAVVLDDIYRWQDIKTMIDWTFNSYIWK